MRDNQGREILRSRTSMSHRFEDALRVVQRDFQASLPITAGRGAVARMVAEALTDRRKGHRKVPAWTVTRRQRPA